ncbi:MAG: hypothetical protein JST79_06300 [Acidobacteria bacterium]|nr:hypothetical protein [Acidobacteriota bacterium]
MRTLEVHGKAAPMMGLQQANGKQGITATFRHTYRSWLDATGAPVGVQQKLMRHEHLSTTMNVYGNALMELKREANSKIVQLVLGQEIGELGEEISDEIYAGYTSRLN